MLLPAVLQTFLRADLLVQEESLLLVPPTHGNSSGECVFAVLPCGLVVRISSAYICDVSGKIIETNGNIPEIYVEPSIQDIIDGRDPVFERAITELDRVCRK